MFQEFKKFIMRGNVLDLAIGVIIGAAFGKIVTSMVNDIMMPVVGLLVGKVDFSNLFIPLNGQHYASLADAKRIGAPTINYGVFANAVIEFLIVSFVIFIVIKQVNRLFKPAPVPVTTKNCPECCTAIPLEARRCPACTSALAADATA